MRLVVSRKTELALEALQLLDAAKGEVVPGSELSEALDASAASLSQVLRPLINEGWVASRPGPDGGYLLSTKRLSVLQVLEAIEGPIVDGVCVLDGGDCSDQAPCVMHDVWAATRADLAKALGKRSALSR